LLLLVTGQLRAGCVGFLIGCSDHRQSLVRSRIRDHSHCDWWKGAQLSTIPPGARDAYCDAPTDSWTSTQCTAHGQESSTTVDEVHHILKKYMYHGLPKDWRHCPGRPRHTWLQDPGSRPSAAQPRLNLAWRHAQDRRWWRQRVEMATLQSGACLWWWSIYGKWEEWYHREN